MDLSTIFKRTWEITWKHKGLWLLGILASCSGGGSSGSGNFGRLSSYQGDGGEFPQLQRWFDSVPQEVWIALIVGIVLALLLLSLIFWALAAVGNGGLISAFQAAETGGEVTLGSAFRDGLNVFWKLLVIQLALGLAGAVIFLPAIGAGVVFSILTLGIGLLCLIPLLCLLIPLGIALSIYTLLVQIALIVEDLEIVAAFQRAWGVLWSKLGEVIVMVLLLGIGGFVVNLVLMAPFIALALPFITGLLIGTDTSGVVGLSASVIGVLLYIPILLVAGGIVRTFITGAWTLTYRELTVQAA